MKGRSIITRVHLCSELGHCVTKEGVMRQHQWIGIVLGIGFAVLLQACAESSTQRMINANDHVGLANYYTQQAQELRGKAKGWQKTAEFYEKHSEPRGKTEPQQNMPPIAGQSLRAT